MSETSLVIIEEKEVSSLLVPGGLEPTLEQLRQIKSEFVSDLTTEAGRKAISSFAYKFARSKTYVDKIGKDHLAKKRSELKEADSELKRFRDECDLMKNEVRKDLTEWENVEKKRVEDIKTWIQEIVTKGEVEYYSLGAIKETLAELKAININEPIDIIYGELAGLAACKLKTARTNLSALYIVRKKEVDDIAEARRLEAERVENERVEREKKVAEKAAMEAQEEAERLAKEVAEEAKKEAEDKDRIAKKAIAKAEADKVAAEAKEAAAKVAAARAEREKKEAAEKAINNAEESKKKAEADKLAAVEAEKQRQADAKKLQEEAEAKRQADKEHRDSILKDISDDILKFIRIDESGAARSIVDLAVAMAEGKVRHVKVMF